MSKFHFSISADVRFITIQFHRAFSVWAELNAANANRAAREIEIKQSMRDRATNGDLLREIFINPVISYRAIERRKEIEILIASTLLRTPWYKNSFRV